jgi:hypothetical protein
MYTYTLYWIEIIRMNLTHGSDTNDDDDDDDDDGDYIDVEL